jgi:hypothetical protein
VAVTRTDFQQLADVRIAEAAALLSLPVPMPDGAYYLAGYSVECALKACIAKLTNLHDFPPLKRFVEDCYTHDLDKLVRAAGIDGQLKADTAADAELSNNWAVVKDWKETSRYDRKTPAEARALYDAITDAAHGVLPWVKLRW